MVLPTPGIPANARIASTPSGVVAVTASITRASSVSRPVNAAVSCGSEYRILG